MTVVKLNRMIAGALAVPPLMLGHAPEPQDDAERGDHLLVMSEAIGLPEYDMPQLAREAAYRRGLRALGIWRRT